MLKQVERPDYLFDKKRIRNIIFKSCQFGIQSYPEVPLIELEKSSQIGRGTIVKLRNTKNSEKSTQKITRKTTRKIGEDFYYHYSQMEIAECV